MEQKEYTIDAKGKRLGRIASEAASILLGKNTIDHTKHTVTPAHVKIENARLLDVPYKRNAKEYRRYSGYPGGLKSERLDHLANRRGYSEIIKRAISGMLPKNRLHKIRMKNIEITE
jgi:large subunit ribosomal protein L13